MRLQRAFAQLILKSGLPALDHVGPEQHVAAMSDFYAAILEEALV